MRSLTRREKILLQALIFFAAGVVIYYLLIAPFIGLAGETDDELRNTRNDIDKLEKIYAQYRDVKQKISKYDNMLGKSNDNITSLVEQWANSTGIARNIAYTRTSQATIQNKYNRITADIKIEGAAIQTFMKFLHEIENSQYLLKVNYLRINRGLKGTNTYDINLKIDNFVLKK